MSRKNKSEVKNIIDNGIPLTPSVTPVPGNPADVTEMLNAYGEYEIQRTADTANTFPAIAQGYSKKNKNKKK